MLRDSIVVVVVVVVVVVRTRPRAIPPAMITMRKSAHGFPFVSHIWVAYGAPLGGPSGAPLKLFNFNLTFCMFRHTSSEETVYKTINK